MLYQQTSAEFQKMFIDTHFPKLLGAELIVLTQRISLDGFRAVVVRFTATRTKCTRSLSVLVTLVLRLLERLRINYRNANADQLGQYLYPKRVYGPADPNNTSLPSIKIARETLMTAQRLLRTETYCSSINWFVDIVRRLP